MSCAVCVSLATVLTRDNAMDGVNKNVSIVAGVIQASKRRVMMMDDGDVFSLRLPATTTDSSLRLWLLPYL
jgi:hypothetical protein